MTQQHPKTVTFGATEALRLGQLLGSEAGRALAIEHFEAEPWQRLAHALTTGARIIIEPEKP